MNNSSKSPKPPKIQPLSERYKRKDRQAQEPIDTPIAMDGRKGRLMANRKRNTDISQINDKVLDKIFRSILEEGYSQVKHNPKLYKITKNNLPFINKINPSSWAKVFLDKFLEYPHNFVISSQTIVETAIKQSSKKEREIWLLKAIKHKNISVLDILLSYPNDFNINCQNSKGWSLVHYATIYDHNEILNYLIKHGASLNEKNINGNTPIFLGVKYKKHNATKKLIEAGINLEYKDKLDNSLLHIAVKNHDAKMVKILLDASLDINSKNKYFRTILLDAIIIKNEEITEFLLDNNADIYVKDILGNTGLHYSVYNNDIEMTYMLLEQGLLTIAKNLQNKTPIQIAQELGYKEITKLIRIHEMKSKIIKKYFFDNYCRIESNTIRLKFMDLLSNPEMKIDFRNYFKLEDTEIEEIKNSIFIAFRQEFYNNKQTFLENLIKTIIDTKANPNITINKDDWTPLHLVARYGNSKMVTKLLNYDANKDNARKENKQKQRPYDLAKYNSDNEIKELLKPYRSYIYNQFNNRQNIKNDF